MVTLRSHIPLHALVFFSPFLDKSHTWKVSKGVKSLLDFNSVVTHLNQGLWKDVELEGTSAYGQLRTKNKRHTHDPNSCKGNCPSF